MNACLQTDITLEKEKEVFRMTHIVPLRIRELQLLENLQWRPYDGFDNSNQSAVTVHHLHISPNADVFSRMPQFCSSPASSLRVSALAMRLFVNS